MGPTKKWGVERPMRARRHVEHIVRGRGATTTGSEACWQIVENDEEVDLATQKLTSIIEPLIIVALAVIVAGIVIAIVLPLLQLQRTG